MRKYATITSVILLVPFLLFLMVLKGSNRNAFGYIENDDVRNSIYITSRSSINEIAQLVASPCKCDCDISSGGNILESTTAQSGTYQNDYDIESSNNLNSRSNLNSNANTVIFVITPTYTRATQMADMTRLGQTLMLVKDVFWIVVEDATELNKKVSAFMNRTGIPHVHLLGPRPNTHLDKRSGRGVSNRLKALEWLRETYKKTNQKGVIYFADDDNAYDVRIFSEMRSTIKVSVFPVGLLAKIGLSSPILDINTGKIIGFHDPFISRRKFAVDMAGFAVNLQLFLSRPKATMPYKLGYEEDYFIKSMGVKIQDLEPKANNCTEILVWHTKTQWVDLPLYSNMIKEKKYNETNLPLLYNNVLKTT